MRAHRARTFEAGGVVDSRLEAQGGDLATPGTPMKWLQSASARALRSTRRSSSTKLSNSTPRASSIGSSARLSAGSLSIVSRAARS